MGEIKVETGTTSSKISNITSAGTAMQYDAINDSLETTNISPFVEFAAASESLSKLLLTIVQSLLKMPKLCKVQ